MENAETNESQQDDPHKIEDAESTPANRLRDITEEQNNGGKKHPSAKHPPKGHLDKKWNKRYKGWWQRNHPIISTLANVIMAFGTLAAVKIASQSLKLTQQSFLDNNKKDSVLISLATRSFDSSNNNFRQSNNELKNMADASTNSANYSGGMLSEYKREFEIENQPILQIKFIKFDPLVKNERLFLVMS